MIWSWCMLRHQLVIKKLLINGKQPHILFSVNWQSNQFLKFNQWMLKMMKISDFRRVGGQRSHSSSQMVQWDRAGAPGMIRRMVVRHPGTNPGAGGRLNLRGRVKVLGLHSHPTQVEEILGLHPHPTQLEEAGQRFYPFHHSPFP